MRTIIMIAAAAVLAFVGTVALHRFSSSSGMEKVHRTIVDCLHDGTVIERNLCYRSFCHPTEDCLSTIFASATTEAGPEVGTRVLTDLLPSLPASVQSTGHELEHLVGRAAADALGPSGDSFMRCPTDFAYGCQHGFLEEVLATGRATARTATSLCDHLQHATDKQTLLCEHGIGHGLMMFEGHRLAAALRDCSVSGRENAVRGCAQGVYMENFIGYAKKDPGSYGYGDDPLAPCDTTGDKDRQWACYINHATYLLRRFDFDIQRASHTCLDAPLDMIDTCVFDFGQLAADPEWQPMMVQRHADAASRRDSIAAAAATLCTLTPADHHRACNDGAIEHLLNYKRFSDADAYCTFVESALHDDCLTAIRTHQT